MFTIFAYLFLVLFTLGVVFGMWRPAVYGAYGPHVNSVFALLILWLLVWKVFPFHQ